MGEEDMLENGRVETESSPRTELKRDLNCLNTETESYPNKKQAKEVSNDDIHSEVSNPVVSPIENEHGSSFPDISSQPATLEGSSDQNDSLENPKDRKNAETAGAGTSSNKAISPRKSCRVKETETSGDAGQSSKDLSAQAEPRGIKDTEPLIARQLRTSSREVASVEIDPSCGIQHETSEHVISSDLEVVNIASES